MLLCVPLSFWGNGEEISCSNTANESKNARLKKQARIFVTEHHKLTRLAHYGSNTLMRELTFLFQISPSSGVPIYRQIMDQIRSLILSGRWQVGTMVPSVRQMATDLDINAMTVSKAYARLEIDCVLERVRGTGMRVRATATGTSPTPIGSLSSRKEQLRPAAIAFLVQGKQIGLSVEQSIAVVAKVAQEISDASSKAKILK